MKKIKTKDGKIIEVEKDYVLKDGEEECPEEPSKEEEEEEVKKIEAVISKKIEKALKDIHDNPVKKSPMYRKEESTLETSVIETDPYLRSKRPFVKLSKKMEDFVDDMRSLAKGGVPRSILKALSEGDDTAGGFLVPTEFQAEVVRYATEESIIRPRASVFSMARDILTLPKFDQSSANFGGVELYWTAEKGDKTASQPAFGRITLNAKKLIGLCYSSDELLEDAAVNVANYLVSLFGEAIAYEEDYRFLRGTGMGQPLGIINTSGINIIGRNASSRIVLEDIVGMYVGHPAWADLNAVWITTKAGIGQLMRIGTESTGGISLWMMNLKDAIVPVIQGKRVLITEKLPALGSQGDIILARLDYYYIGDRGGLKVDSSIHTRFANDETAFRFVKRVDGQPAIASAFTILGE